ncbi:MAG TPA: hypothetical protein DCL41_07845 [Bdellovibrionales bacterium]|nr:hypothetical protein [Pseudobdellovibrionaceae bacterium]HAG91768.1 hypothetical protein [Bdellovibrionales bacterium]|tara:strand:- start:386 stop:1975 length:1590 start_codon:yes stop_codon:yes gene_type:complete
MIEKDLESKETPSSLESFEDLDFIEDPPHVDERWLVSYADMMTLLFGLFVLLFAMNKMDQKDVEKIKNSTTQQFGKNEEVNKQIPEVAEKKVLSHQILLEELEDKQKEVDQLKKTLIGLQAQTEVIDNLKLSLARIEGKNKDLTAQLNSLKSEPAPKAKTKIVRIDPNPDLKAEIQNLKLQLELANKIPPPQQVQVDPSEKYKTQIKKLLATQYQLKKDLMSAKESALNAKIKLSSVADEQGKLQSLALANSKMKADNDQLVNANKQLEAKFLSLQSQWSQLKAKSSNRSSEISALSSKSKTLESENQSLRDLVARLKEKNSSLNGLVEKNQATRELASQNLQSLQSAQKNLEGAKLKLNQENEELKAQVLNAKTATQSLEAKASLYQNQLKDLEALYAKSLQNRSFLAIMIKWPTRDHDVDLIIEDPNGVKYDYKKKGERQLAGRFALDTKRGPGAELWLSDQVIPGTYKATYYFFNQYGNLTPTQVSATIYSPKGQVEIKPRALDISKKRSVTVTFHVSKEGQVTLN